MNEHVWPAKNIFEQRNELKLIKIMSQTQ